MYRVNEELIKNADDCYRLAEQRAAHYFQSLHVQVTQKAYVSTITKDIKLWKQNHLHHVPSLSAFWGGKGKPALKDYHHYIQWLSYTGKLEHYLDRSVSYIFLRDLGKALDAAETQTMVQRVVDRLKNHLNKRDNSEPYNIAGLYRWAQQEGLESTMIWVVNKLNSVSAQIPKGMDAEQAQRKLIKIIAGVMMHEAVELGEEISSEERMHKLDRAIRLGYCYGLTYPFIDDLLDTNVLSDQEKKQYADFVRTTLVTGSVPELGVWRENNFELIRFIHAELQEAFAYIKSHQGQETMKTFFEQAYVFFHAQEMDREKDLSNASYTNEELYIPIILKSAFSRLIARSVTNVPEDEGFANRTFFYGIYNQLADDFADLFDDLRDGAVTPYTYYLKYHDRRLDLINPFELYWTVISHLIHNVYHSDTKTCDVILARAINGLKRYKERMGTQKYNEVMELFACGNSEFNRLLQKIVRKADDVDFFDKLLRDHILTMLKKERKEREDFYITIETVRNEIHTLLFIPKSEYIPLLNEPIIDAANYSLEGDGKRLRPIITWVMGVHTYGIKPSAIVPLVRSLEYMHTASLIFDDLPSQDNASIRRGHPTLHQIYNVAIAELTGLFLTQKATYEQAALNSFDAKTVLHLIQYSAQMTADMCRGQAMDLGSKSKPLTLAQLNLISRYKTGIAFEASLIMPALLVQATELEIQALKTFAHHAGIAFQIKDDLLDVEGVATLLGKPIGKDTENNNSTFVSILGQEGARRAMMEHYCLAIEALREVPRNTTFLKHVLNYIVNRDH